MLYDSETIEPIQKQPKFDELMEHTNDTEICRECIKNKSEVKELLEANDNLMKNVEHLLESNRFIANQLDALKQMAALKNEVDQLEKELSDFKTSTILSSQFLAKMKDALKQTLSSNQIDLIIGQKNRVRWTNAEISKAFTLRYFSKRSYKYKIIYLNIPMPYQHCNATQEN